jgi:DNA-binding SARP family transcriptional activator/class 3 adenylate cyclase
MVELSSGTLTLLFSDLEESTELLRRLGPSRYAELLASHRALMIEAVRSNGGSEVDTQGDSFFCVFRTAREAVMASAAIQRSHLDHAFPGGANVLVRIGLHTGEPVLAGDRYVGLAVHRAARIMNAAHGGQILVSWQTAELIVDEMPEGVAVNDLGEHLLKGLERPERLYQVRVDGLHADFPPPRGLEAASRSDADDVVGLDVRILGPLEIRAGESRLTFAGERRGALLALLLLNANRVISIDQLIDELWGEDPPGSGAKAVQVRVSQLRKSFADAGLDDLILTRPPGYVIELAPDQLDLGRFEHLVAESDAAVAAGEPARSAELLREALALWRGQPLAEFGSAPFARGAGARLEELRLGAVERRIEADMALGRHADLVGELEALVSEHPFRERLRAQLMLALYRSGRQAEALEAYRAARGTLMDELGLEPSHSLQDLEREILHHDPKLAPAVATDSPVETPAAWETPTPERSILVAPSEPARIQSLLAVAEPLTKRPRRELILSALVDEGIELDTTTAELESARAALGRRGVPARIAAFTSADRGPDLVRLASEQDVDLLVVDAPDTLLAAGAPPDDLAYVWREAPCDVVAVVARGDMRLGDRPVVVPFGGAEHDWAAVEIGAWLAAAHSSTLQLLGSSAEPQRGKRDASRSLAVVSLVVQRAAGISAKPLLVAPGEELWQAARGAGLLVVGLSERWSEEGLGLTRLELAREAGVPTLLVRKGLRPGGLTPPDRMTRYTWSFVHAGEVESG